MGLTHDVSQLSLEHVIGHMPAELPLMLFLWNMIRNRLLIIADLTKELATL